MAYTQADLDTLKAARLAMATGQRIESVTIAGDTFSFANGATDRDLARLIAIIDIDLATDYNPMAHAINGGR